MQSTVDEALQLLVDLASEMVGSVWSASPRTADRPRGRGTDVKTENAQTVGYGISLEDPPGCRPRHRLSQAAAINGHPSSPNPGQSGGPGQRLIRCRHRERGRPVVTLVCRDVDNGRVATAALPVVVDLLDPSSCVGRVERLRTPTVNGRPIGRLAAVVNGVLSPADESR